MTGERWLLDTVFIQALLNHRDQYHAQAKALSPRLRTVTEIWVTEAVLVEVGNALSAVNRAAAVKFIQDCYTTPNIRVVTKAKSPPKLTYRWTRGFSRWRRNIIEIAVPHPPAKASSPPVC